MFTGDETKKYPIGLSAASSTLLGVSTVLFGSTLQRKRWQNLLYIGKAARSHRASDEDSNTSVSEYPEVSGEFQTLSKGNGWD